MKSNTGLLDVTGDEKVSVYIPTRNRRRLLERAVASVLNQTYRNIELIVVDDCSTDDTREYLAAVSDREPRLAFYAMQAQKGAPAARNHAIRNATGEFITGLDDDDEFREDRIEKFMSAWKTADTWSSPVSGLFSESMINDGVTCHVTNDRRSSVAYLDLFEHNYIGNQMFCPKQHFVDIGGFDEEMPAWQDLETFMRLLRRHGSARLLPDPTYIYHVERNRDRISTDARRLRAAYERIQLKHDVPAELKRLLFLQMCSPFYGVRPSWTDMKKFIKWDV